MKNPFKLSLLSIAFVFSSSVLAKPVIKTYHYDNGVVNCYAGASLWINAVDADSDTRIQYLVPQSGTGFLKSIGDISSTGTKTVEGKHYVKLPCPSSTEKTEFVIRLYQSSTGVIGNQIRVPLSTGPYPVPSKTTSLRYETAVEGKFLTGVLKVFRDGIEVGVITNGNPYKLTIPPNIHKTYSGNYTFQGQHGTSKPIFIQPFNFTRINIAANPSIVFERETDEKCLVYRMRPDVKACRDLMALGLLNVADPDNPESEDDSEDVDVYIPLARGKTYRDVAVFGGYSTYVELSAAVDYYQLQKYPKAFQEYADTESLVMLTSGKPSLTEYYPVIVYSGIYQGETNQTLNAESTIATEIAMDVTQNIANADVLIRTYKTILALPSLQRAVARYNQLMSTTISVEYQIPYPKFDIGNTVAFHERKVLQHRIVSPLMMDDTQLQELMRNVARDYLMATIYE